MIVDGYLGIRDGRTVYVNVANIVSGDLYTNIYLISYNQGAEKDTTNIFSKILLHWKFNTNITILGHCRQNPTMFCLQDDECPIGDNCDSLKARVIRDVDRMSDLVKIKEIISDYYEDNGQYPLLSSGSYILYNTLSVWPSWVETFEKIAGKSLPIDPVNALGDCGGDNFNKETCWDEATKRFSEILPDLPTSSLVYSYSTNSAGLTANSCAVMESGMNIQGDSICSLDICLDFDGDSYGNPASMNCPAPGTGLLDCNDLDELVQDGAPENPGASNCNDGIDNDCDGLIDCNDGDCSLDPSCAIVPGCPNGDCGPGEDCNSCPADCGACPVTCPDGFCDLTCNECAICPADCMGATACCGVAGCNPAIGECTSCLADCDASISSNCCGDGICDLFINENALNCPADCTCSDDDGDLYIAEALAPGSCGNTCGPGPVFVTCIGNNDCDDSNATGFPINPGADEICDGIDNDCDVATIDGADEGPYLNSKQADICAGTFQSCYGVLGWQDDYSGITPPYESPNEINCSDGIDNDCDGTCDASDNACGVGILHDPDCGGGCNDINESDHQNAATPGDCNQCSNLDSNVAKDGDLDGDQFGEDWTAYPFMVDKCDSDCGVVVNTVHIGDFENGAETICDGIDNDCDGSVDEGCDNDGDDYCDNTMTVVGSPAVCSQGGGDCNDGNSGINPAALEICGNSADEDCDGNADSCVFCYLDGDSDGYGDPSKVTTEPSVCPPGRVLDNNDCDDSINWINPLGTENCDGYDNNCDDTDHSDGVNPSAIDELCDIDNDGYCDTSVAWFATALCPDPSIAANFDCNDNDNTVNPGILVDGCDGVDNDCDGSIDEDANMDTCEGTCTDAEYTWLTTFCCGNDANEANPYQLPESNCSDLSDNDCNGDIDCDDANCVCPCTFDAKVPCSLL